jgi:hypothetical protein
MMVKETGLFISVRSKQLKMHNSQSCYEFQQEKKILEIIICNGTLQIIQQISHNLL